MYPWFEIAGLLILLIILVVVWVDARKQKKKIKDLEIKMSHLRARVFILEDMNEGENIPF